MKYNRLYKLYLTDCIYKNVFVGDWIVRNCVEEEAKRYLKLYAHSMKIEVIDTDTMNIICEYEITRQKVANMLKVIYRDRIFIDTYKCIDNLKELYARSYFTGGISGNLYYFKLSEFNYKTLAGEDIISIEEV